MARQEIAKRTDSPAIPDRPFDGGVTGLRTGSGEPSQRVVRVDVAAGCCASAFDYAFHTLRDIGNEIAVFNTGDGLGIAQTIEEAVGLGLQGLRPASGLTTPSGGMPQPFVVRGAGLPPDSAGFATLIPTGGLDQVIKWAPLLSLNLLSELFSRLQTRLQSWVRYPEGPCLQCLMNKALGQVPQRRTRFELLHRGAHGPVGTISTRVHQQRKTRGGAPK